MVTHIIVDAKSGVPVQKVGLCSGYRNENDAKRACETWNRLAISYGKLKPVKIRRIRT